MNSIHDQRYIKLIESLKTLRKSNRINQDTLAEKLSKNQSYIAKVEGLERRLDIIELNDWLKALEIEPVDFLTSINLFSTQNIRNDSLPPLPEPGKVNVKNSKTYIPLAWQGKKYDIELNNTSPDSYLQVEKIISSLFSSLNNPDNRKKNRVAIFEALKYAFDNLPNTNPSDVYHHIVYRIYLREFYKSKPDQSWVRAGGEALELFIEDHYREVLIKKGITIKALISKANKEEALSMLGLSDEVGGSKLDIALYGHHDGYDYIFGGIHVKASLAERVSDDVPCSEAMMKKGFSSYLFTLDAKSFPPPQGDLINRGELGSEASPSDKRKYIEEHGSFDACFSYNIRTNPSGSTTKSGKKIYASTFDPKQDPLPKIIITSWKKFKKSI